MYLSVGVDTNSHSIKNGRQEVIVRAYFKIQVVSSQSI